MAKYLLDSNVFIQAKNMYYRFDFCGGFWDWIRHAHNIGLVYSIKKVRDELVAVNDPCCAWAKAMPASFFLEDMNDGAVMAAYGSVMQWAHGTDFKQHAKIEFAKHTVADAFLIAVALAHRFEIVTQEQSKPEAKKKIYLPDAAAANGVQTLYIYDMLSQHTVSTFAHKLPPLPQPIPPIGQPHP